MSDDTNREKEIFSDALELDAQARREFLLSACGPDHELRQRVETLLKAFEAASHFIPARSAPVEETPMALPPFQPTGQAGEVIGRYRLLQTIGEGGFGTVYLAEQRVPVRRQVALKVIKTGMDTKQVIGRFDSERQALAMMDHPNIAKVLDAGATASGRPYFVMELVHGVPITQYCDEQNLPPTERLKLFMQVCRAVQHAHQKGIIHRDIKPSNILVSSQDGMPVSKVIDFGIAKATQPELAKNHVTQFQQLMGTPAYMSPEQAALGSSVDLDTRSDIYSLGVLLYELLVGQPPFELSELLEAGVDEMRRILREREPLRPSLKLSQTLAGDDVRSVKVPSSRQPPAEPETRGSLHHLLRSKRTIALLRGDLDWIVMKCLEKDRTRRYETAGALVMDIERYLGNEPVLARPPSAAYRFQKAVRRHRLVFAAASGMTVILLLGLAGVTWQWHRAEHQRLSVQHQLYVAKMGLAQAAWEQNNVSRLKQLLDETATAPQRGFEWFFWQRQLHLELKTFQGHLGPVLAVAFSPDGRRIVTGSADRSARIWDADTNAEPLALSGHGDVVSSAAFSRDGAMVVTGSWDKTAKIWDAASGRLMFPLTGHTGAIYSVAVSPDGECIVTGSADHSAIGWDIADGNRLFTLSAHSDAIFSVAFSPDGQRLATGSWDGTVRIWPANGGDELLALRAADATISSVAFSSDGRQIAAGAFDSTVRIWDAATGAPLSTLVGHGAPVYSLGWSPDGKRILSGSMDQTAKVWDATDGRELFTLRGHRAPIFSAVFSPDGERIATGSGNLAIGPSGNPFLIGGGPGEVKVWSAENNQSPLTVTAHSSEVLSAAFSPDSLRVVTGGWDNSAKVWDSASAVELLCFNGHSGPVHAVAFSSNGRRIVTGSFDGTAILWDAGSTIPLRTYQASGPIPAVAFSPDDQKIITGGATAIVWDANHGQKLHHLKGHSDIYLVAFSPDGRRLLTGAWDGTACLWDNRGEQLHVLQGHKGPIRGGAFSPNGQRLVLASLDQTATVWDTANGKLLLTVHGHGNTIFSASFSFDGRRILTSSADQTAKVWDASRGLELLTLKGHIGSVFSAAFSSDGQRVVTAGADKTIKIWQAASSEQVAGWRNQEQVSAELLKMQQRGLDRSNPSS